MAKQFENTLERFARPAPGIIYYAVVFIAICLLITASVISAFSLNFTIAAISILAAGSVIVLAVIAIRYQRSLVGEKAGGWISWESALPELQRQNLNIAVDELSRILKVEADAAGDLQSVFIVAGDLALRQIQQEENVPVMRHVSVSGIPFDAVFTKERYPRLLRSFVPALARTRAGTCSRDDAQDRRRKKRGRRNEHWSGRPPNGRAGYAVE
jgi:hypothetical protein